MVKKIGKRLRSFFSKRGILLLILFGAMGAVLLVRLFQLQIIHGQDYADSFTVRTTATRTLKSTRGRIYDCNGKLLAYNELASTVTIEDNGSYDTTREKNLALNGEIYRLTQMIRNNGDTLSQDFHIIVDDKGEYAFDSDNEVTLGRFRADVYGYQTVSELTPDQKDASADQIMTELASAERFAITGDDDPYTDEKTDYAPYTEAERTAAGLPADLTKQQMLDIVVVRYQLSLVSYQRYMAVTVASNVSEKTVADVKENQDTLQGVAVSEDYIRKYVDSEALAPILGYTGQPSAEELASLQEQDDKYTNSSVIGKAGIEQALETSLQGSDGSEEVTIDNLGKVLSVNENSRVEPVQGDDVYLTIDSELQDALYKILEQRIAGIILTNLTNARSVDASAMSDNDSIPIASYDCYNAVIGNNMVDTDHFSAEDATDNEKSIYHKLIARQSEILSWVDGQLTASDPAAYSALDSEQQAYFDYLINDYLTTELGILDSSAIDTEDQTYQAYMTDGSISPAAFLHYAANHNWINVSKLSDAGRDYLTSDEVYQAVDTYIQEHAAEEDAFNKLLYKYMLQDDVITPHDVMMLLYDQGVLSKDDGVYEGFSSGQMTAYDLLVNKISVLQITPAMLALDPCSGSIVMTDPDTGAVRACVTYPGYDNNRLSNTMDSAYFSKLNSDLSSPFYNKATQQLTAPGSTFKMVTACAGLEEGVITPDEGINCTGIFGEDLDFLSDADRVHCWNQYGHGVLNLAGAIQNSCNVYFCTVGYRLGLDADGNYDQTKALTEEEKYAAMFGLNEKSGVEIPESEPHVTDSLPIPSAIGQGTNQFTTVQLARYVSAIANRGTLYKLTLVDRITDPDGNTIKQNEADDTGRLDFGSTVWDNLYTGMEDAVSSDTAWSDFTNQIYVYGKTGTAQESMLRPDHALIVGFTKTQDTENISHRDVAFAVRIAEGYSSRNASLTAKDALNYYFNLTEESQTITGAANADSMSQQVVAD